jgi:hypothetical protein
VSEIDEKTVKVARNRDVQVVLTISVKAPQDEVPGVIGEVLKRISGKWDDFTTPPDLGPLPPGA